MQSSRLSRIRNRRRLAACCLLALPTTISDAQSLLGSRYSMLLQNEEARQHDFTYLRTSADVRDFAKRGVLVRLRGNSDYAIESDEVSFPYARPEVKLFVERLAEQYRDACGERLVVTSLTRPITRQPHNASAISVHPTGMAADLRRSSRASCRSWLEATLLDLEGRGVLEATREQYPPHYHVALFPNPYLRAIGVDALPPVQVAKEDLEVDKPSSSRSSRSRTVHASSRTTKRSSRSHAVVAKRSSKSSKSAKASKSSKSSRSHTVVASRGSHGKKYKVGRGDSLWTIAQRHGVSVAKIKQANRISSRRIKPGQVLSIPTR
jgi:LysM repeat protein